MGNEQSNSKELTKNGNIPEKLENGSANGIAANITSNGLEIDVKGETIIRQNGEPVSLILTTDSSEPDSSLVVKSDCQPAEAQVVSEIPAPTILKEEVKKEKGKLFGKMFKKKAEPPADVKSVEGKETSSEDQTDVSPPATDPHPEAANLQQTSESLLEPESVTLVLQSPAEEKAPETDNGSSQPVESQEESNPEENPVMNFFKTLVTPTKTSKKETATADAIKDQSQKESQPAATTTVAQVSEPPAPKGMSIPPPPPPEPPKMEIKGEPAAKSVKPVPKEEPKAAAKKAESSKAKSAKDSLSKFFRPKVLLGVKASKRQGASASEVNPPAKATAGTIKEAPQPAAEVQPGVEVQNENKVEPQETAKEVAQSVVEKQVVDGLPQPVVEAEKVDPSKASTLEAAAKPEPPPPAQEEKKTASKSPFISIFKSKVLLDHMTTKVQAASTSGVRLLRRTTGVAADPKKATSAPTAAAEPAQAAKAKDEPKAAAKSSEAVVDNKPVSVASQAADDGASVPKKLEKRNSIQLFFKNLGQKRHSTDAGVQTEPVTVAPAAEKGK